MYNRRVVQNRFDCGADHLIYSSVLPTCCVRVHWDTLSGCCAATRMFDFVDIQRENLKPGVFDCVLYRKAFRTQSVCMGIITMTTDQLDAHIPMPSPALCISLTGLNWLAIAVASAFHLAVHPSPQLPYACSSLFSRIFPTHNPTVLQCSSALLLTVSFSTDLSHSKRFTHFNKLNVYGKRHKNWIESCNVFIFLLYGVEPCCCCCYFGSVVSGTRTAHTIGI